MTSARLFELLHEAGLPRGVVQLVHGEKKAVDAGLDHDSQSWYVRGERVHGYYQSTRGSDFDRGAVRRVLSVKDDGHSFAARPS